MVGTVDETPEAREKRVAVVQTFVQTWLDVAPLPGTVFTWPDAEALIEALDAA